ncbi:branched-chain amino acid ABC transporter permease [Castellaniella sp.]|uniref:branched-chain amino acid ABC transporter permease n=1 Tax=Castellaniella sp. TaxID=1955812 RepID=UPI002AFEFE1A|nr:branched-chain amino acid ABC transporter permease [Castellaniella sp.]
MSPQLLFMQALNGLQYGILLFLLAAGLTLVFGIMSFINLAHGALYMMGAYFAAAAFGYTNSFLLAIMAGLGGAMLLGVLLDRSGFSRLYPRAHLDQVLATFGLMLFFNEAVRMIWGSAPIFMSLPDALSNTVMVLGTPYPLYRLVIILVGLLVALGLYLLIERTRIGMLIRAGASNRAMVSALGVNIGWLNTFIFALGAGLAGLGGAMVGPILSVQPGMGDSILIMTLVVIVIGGIGSIRGAFLGALVVGLVDTLGRTVMPALLSQALAQELASTLGAAISSLAVYVLMVIVLAIKPEGLFPVKKR